MPRPIQAGDTIRCINPNQMYTKLGDIYECLATELARGMLFVKVVALPSQIELWYHVESFELVDP